MAQLELALFDLRENDLHGAEMQLISICNRYPTFARAPYYLGMLYLTHGVDERAIGQLQEAARLDKNDPLTRTSLAIVCLRMGREKEARAYAESAIRLDPQLPEPYMVLARVDDHHGTAIDAIADVRKYLERSPRKGTGYFFMGHLYARQADKESAEHWLKLALQEEPDVSDYWVTLGRIYYEMFGSTKEQEAINCFEKALTLVPTQWEAHHALGRVMRNRGKWDAAITHFEAAMRSSPQPADVEYDLGLALLKVGRTQEGRKLLDQHQARLDAKRAYGIGYGKLYQAIDKAPKDRSRRYELARFCLKFKQYSQAEAVIREGLKQFGDDPVLQDLLSQVRAARTLQRPATTNEPERTPTPLRGDTRLGP